MEHHSCSNHCSRNYFSSSKSEDESMTQSDESDGKDEDESDSSTDVHQPGAGAQPLGCKQASELRKSLLYDCISRGQRHSTPEQKVHAGKCRLVTNSRFQENTGVNWLQGCFINHFHLFKFRFHTTPSHGRKSVLSMIKNSPQICNTMGHQSGLASPPRSNV